MAFTPKTNTKVYLLQVPIELDNKNQLDFDNATEQYNYFISQKVKDFNYTDGSYVRKDNVLYVPFHIDKLWAVNYLMYQNTDFTNKWFYCFITNKEYISDECTKCTITTDVFQTWQFDYKIKRSFVEREMIDVDDDVPGANLYPEGLETGEMQIDGTASFDGLDPVYVIAYTGDTYGESTTIKQDGFEYNGIFSSITFIVTNFLQNALYKINQYGQGEYIFTVFSVPKIALQDFIPDDTLDDGTRVYYDVPIEENFKQSPVIKSLNSRPSSIDGYTPKNKKLLTYPYLYLGFNPQNGSSKIYRYENFTNATPSFKIISEINPNPTIQFIPQNYRGQTGDSLSDNASMNGYPTISYKNDYYNTWLAQNSQIISLNMQQEQYNYEVGTVQSAINQTSSIVSSAMQGDAGALLQGANLGLSMASADKNHEFYVKQQMAQIEKQKLLPDKATMSSSNATMLGYEFLNDNIFTRYSIKKQFAQRIDKYFDAYGYATNEFKQPNLNNRPNWNYVKTTGINIVSDAPQEDVQLIKNIFDNGVTIWHNPDTFLDYSQNNR